MAESIIGFTNDLIPEKVIYTDGDILLVPGDKKVGTIVVNNNPDDENYSQIGALLNADVLGDKVEAADNSIDISAAEFAKELKVNISRDDNNKLELRDDGLYVIDSTYDDTQIKADIRANSQAISDLESTKQDKLQAGPNIEITNNIISAIVPTKVSELENDALYVTEAALVLKNYATKLYVDNKVAAIEAVKFVTVNELPAKGETNIIYLLRKSTEPGKDTYDEYVWIPSKGSIDCWEKIGSTDVDLSLYAKKDWVEAQGYLKPADIEGKADKTELVWEAGEGQHSIQTKGNNSRAIGEASVAEGAEVDAHAYASHAEGYMTSTGIAADYSHAEGYKTTTQGVASHAEGDNTVTNNPAEHAEGRYNKSNLGTIHSIGIGNASSEVPGGARKNAFEVMENGDAYIIGVGDYDGTNPVEAGTVQTIINNKQGKLTAGENISIINNEITAVDTKYTAGENITIENNVISSIAGGKVDDIVDKTTGESLVIDKIGYIDLNAKMSRDFKTNVTVGHLEAGTDISKDDTIADILYKILYREPARTTMIYSGALDSIPTSLAGLTAKEVETSELLDRYMIHIVAGNVEQEESQYVTFAVPNTFKVVKWIADGFDYDIPHTLVEADNYNIYYLDVPSYDEPEGINYIMTIEEE